MEIKAVLLTHKHADHSGELRSFPNARIYVNEEELSAAIGEYIYAKTKENEYYGTLKAYDEGNLRLIVKDKTREKEITVPYNKCRKLRYAVKF